MNSAARSKRKPGDFFKEITGHQISEFTTIMEIERTVEKKLGHRLVPKYSCSNLVSHRGVIPYACTNMEKVNEEIDRQLRQAQKS